MKHHTKQKGDLATAKVIADLTEKEYDVFCPIVSEHLPFDLIAYKEGILYRMQTKYSSDGMIKNTTSWADKHGIHSKKYSDKDFDYYGVFLPSINKVIYPSIIFGGKTVRTELPNKPKSTTPFYWWEDFINFTDEAKKRKPVR